MLYHVVNHAANKIHLILASKVVPGCWEVEGVHFLYSLHGIGGVHTATAQIMRTMIFPILKEIHLAAEHSGGR